MPTGPHISPLEAALNAGTPLFDAEGKLLGVASRVAPTSPEMAGTSPIRVFHRQPNAPSADKRTPRMVDLDEYMAIQPSAIERAFFSFFDFEERKPYEMDGSVAIVAIDGPLMQRGGWWYDGYEAIRGRLEKALEDKAVTAVVLKINSPGGVCSGCFSAARGMRALKEESGKPVLAYADESAYSAAYAMACIADEIYLPPEGGVGSVGVIGVLEDFTAYNDKLGIKVAVITSGEYKADGHPDVPLTKAVVDRYQARINQLARAFAEVVGDARAMSPGAVLKLEAACLYGDDAVKAGLANGVATLEETVAKAQAKGMSSSKARAQSTLGSVRAMKGTHMPPTGTKANSAESNTTEGALVGELVVSHAEFALAAGLPHDASKGDVLAKQAKDRADADAARAVTSKLLSAVGASTSDEAIGKLTAERTTLSELVKAIMGNAPNADKATPADALAKLTADRKSAEAGEAKALIEKAAADGKTAGEKAFGIFEEHGMGALKAHLDALVPHPALVNKAPDQKRAPGGSQSGSANANAPAAPTAEVVLSKDDEKLITDMGLDRAKFIANRRSELEAKAAVHADLEE